MVTAALLTTAVAATVQIVGSSGGMLTREWNTLQAENAIDGFRSEVERRVFHRNVALPFTFSQTRDNHAVTIIASEVAPAGSRTVRLDAVAIKGSRSYRRTFFMGLPEPEGMVPTGAGITGMMGYAGMTNGDNSWWTWPPGMIHHPHLIRRYTRFKYSGQTMSAMPQAPSPWVWWSGHVDWTWASTFSPSANVWPTALDNNLFVLFNGSVTYSNFGGFSPFGFFSEGGVSTGGVNLTSGAPAPLKIAFMDYGGAMGLTMRVRRPGFAEREFAGSWVQATGYQGGPRRTWVIPVPVRGAYLPVATGDTSVISPAIHIGSLGIPVGSRVRVRALGSWRYRDANGVMQGPFTDMIGGLRSRAWFNGTANAATPVASSGSLGFTNVLLPQVNHAPGGTDFANDFLITSTPGTFAEFTYQSGRNYLFVTIPTPRYAEAEAGPEGIWAVVIERGD
jgi:hypothetical protein